MTPSEREAALARCEIPQYGMPADTRGWRQFLAVSRCPSEYPAGCEAKRSELLPFIVWVSTNERGREAPCTHRTWTIHESSARAVAQVSGCPLNMPADQYYCCEAQGRFIE